jgi:purine nucleoside phosphorylase
MEKAQIGIIGGSGLYQMDGLTDVREIGVETPFGKPSDNFILGTLEGASHSWRGTGAGIASCRPSCRFAPTSMR